MSDIINRLRDAAGAVGETVHEVPELRLDRGRVKRAWLVPMTAAAAVIVAIGAGVAVTRSGGNGVDPASSNTAGAVATPKFFTETSGRDIVIRDVGGGSEIDRVSVSAKDEWIVQVQASQDNRVFYAASATSTCQPHLYRLTLNESGHKAKFETLSIVPPKGTQPTSLAVSGDGGKLAYGVRNCAWKAGDDPRKGGIVVADTATGESKTWNGDAGSPRISMSADGRYIAYQAGFPLLAGAYDAVPPVPAVASPAKSGKGTKVTSPQKIVVVSPSTGEVIAVTATPPQPAAAVPPFGITGSAQMSTPAPGEVTTVTTVPQKARPAEMRTLAPGEVATVTPVPQKARPAEMRTPAPGEVATVTPVPQKARPAEMRTPAPGEVATVRPAPQKARRPAEVSKVFKASDPREVYLLDTSAAGGDLGQSRKITLNHTVKGVAQGLDGFVLGPDGRHIYAAIGAVGATFGHSDGWQTTPAKTAIVEYDVADGMSSRVIYQDGKGGLQLLDVDGSGLSFLVARGREYGVVNADGYRELMPSGESGGSIVRAPGSAVFAWGVGVSRLAW